MEEVASWEPQISKLSVGEILQWSSRTFGHDLVFATSLGLEDQLVAQVIADLRLNIDIVTLDTGRLYEETQTLIDQTQNQLGLKIRVITPEHESLEKHLSEWGPLGFRQSVTARRACCAVRKVMPLRRALAGKRAWITGLRRDMSPWRSDVRVVAHDHSFDGIKIAPLWDWTRPMVESWVADRGTPVHPLHAQGYLSIGCAPCTRPVAEGDDERSGRWWWERHEQSECGLHWHEGRVLANPLVR